MKNLKIKKEDALVLQGFTNLGVMIQSRFVIY